MKQLQWLLVSALGIAVTLPAAAQAQAPQALVVTATNVTADSARGRADKSMAQPGDEIRYRLVFTNLTAGQVKNVQFVDPIPQGMVYVLGSATADQAVRVEYSIDGGKSYAAEPMVTAVENGKRVQRAAPRERYTHVRWTVVGSLAPGAQVIAEFRNQVASASGR